MNKVILKVSPISVADMLQRKEKEYNASIWEAKVQSMSRYDKCQFYVKEPGEGYDYARFYVTYVAEGIYFFSNFSAFSSSISNNGFCRVTIYKEGNVFKSLFTNASGKTGYAENSKGNRESFKNLTRLGIMVSSHI